MSTHNGPLPSLGKLTPLLLSVSLAMVLSSCGTSDQKELSKTPSEGLEEPQNAELSALYEKADQYEIAQDHANAAITFGKIMDYSDARQRSFLNWDKAIAPHTISTSESHTVAIKNDGTVVATGSNSSGQCDVSSWTDMIEIHAGPHITVGLTADHTVLTAGQTVDVSDWSDIVAVTATTQSVIGLKIDGTLVHAPLYEGAEEILSDGNYLNGLLKDVVSISGDSHSPTFIALRSDGDAICRVADGWPFDQGQGKVGTWNGGLSCVDAGTYVTVGCKNHRAKFAGLEGTNATASLTIMQNSMKSWVNVADIAAGKEHVLCLYEDSTADSVSLGEISSEIENYNNTSKGETNVQDWSDIVDIDASGYCSIGLCRDGTLVAAGDNSEGACNVTSWTDLRIPF